MQDCPVPIYTWKHIYVYPDVSREYNSTKAAWGGQSFSLPPLSFSLEATGGQNALLSFLPQPLTPRKTATGFNKERPNLRNSLKGQPAQWQQNLEVMQSHDVSAGAKLLGLLLYKTVAMSGVVCLIIASKCSLPWGGGLGRCSDTHVCLGCLWIPSTRWVWNVASHFCP